jgi:tRNA-2-methylthio-N6-dimethylallyladenosine synthase
LHVPAQAGSNRMLGAMNRGYTVEQYLAFVDRARRIVPDVMIASDFIVGFPGETDADFQASLDLIRRCRFKNSFIFKYSPRPGTPAFDRLPDDVPEPVKRQRNHQMLRIQAEVSGEVHHEQVGKVFDVLVEGVSAKARKQRRLVQATVGGAAAQMPIYQPEAAPSVQLSGRTPGDLIVMFDGDESLVGRIVPVRIQSAKPLALFGRVVNRTS